MDRELAAKRESIVIEGTTPSGSNTWIAPAIR
jgi:hypothetical protein